MWTNLHNGSLRIPLHGFDQLGAGQFFLACRSRFVLYDFSEHRDAAQIAGDFVVQIRRQPGAQPFYRQQLIDAIAIKPAVDADPKFAGVILENNVATARYLGFLVTPQNKNIL